MFSSSARIFDALYSFRDMRDEAQKALTLARAATTRPIASALDVGCATGDHAAVIAKTGVREVVGLDIDRQLVALARKKHKALSFVVGDFTRTKLKRQFDAIFSFYGVIAYVRTVAGLRLFAANVARHLTPGGVAVIEPWHLRGEWEPAPAVRHVMTDDFGIARASVATRKKSLVRMDVHYLVASGSRVDHLREVHRVGLFSREEHIDAFHRAGLAARFGGEGPSGRSVIVAISEPRRR